MSELTDEQREIVARAKEVEAERIDLYARAVETRCSDLLPTSWNEFDADAQDPVEVTLTLGLSGKDLELLTDRECRNLVAFFAELADTARFARGAQENEND